MSNRLQSLTTFLWLVPGAVILYTLLGISGSFTLDETRSAWNTASTLPEMFRRAGSYEAKGPLYFVVLWFVRQIFGASEVALRIPGMVFVVGTLLCLASLGGVLFGREGRALPAFFFCLLPESVLNGINARAYSMVVFLATASFLMIVRWVKTGSKLTFALYIVSTVLLLYTHLIFAPLLLVQALYILAHRHAWRGFSIALTTIIFLSVPVLGKLLYLGEHGGVLSWAPPLSLMSGIEVIAPRWILIPAILAMIATQLWPRAPLKVSGTAQQLTQPPLEKRDVALLLLWCFVPGLTAIVYTAISSSSILTLRYTQWSLPGFALALSWLTITVFRKQGQLFPLLFLLLTALTLLRGSGQVENWREAVYALAESKHPSSPTASESVFTYTGFIEAQDPSLLADPLARESLLSPLLTYAPWIEATPLPTLLLDQKGGPMIPLPTAVPRFFLLGRESLLEETTASTYLESELSKRGYQKTSVRWFGIVFLMHFTAAPEGRERSHQTPPLDTERSAEALDPNIQ